MSPQQKQFLWKANVEAARAQHLYPEMAACEAALESHFGDSQLAWADNNLFGMKQHRHAIFQTHNLPMREFENGEWVTVNAEWVKYPDWASCFADRMATLLRLAPVIKNYSDALKAGSPVTYVTEVSRSWATDPNRAEKVLAIYDEIAGDWNAEA